MKKHIEQLNELEEIFNEKLNSTILDLLSIKFSKQISQIVKCQIKAIIQDRIDQTIWINELKDNLNTVIFEYTKDLQEEKKQLNARMDFIEQRMLDILQRMDSFDYHGR